MVLDYMVLDGHEDTGRPLGNPVGVRGGVDRILAPSVAIDAFGRFTVAWYESVGDQPPKVRMRAFRRNATPRRDKLGQQVGEHHFGTNLVCRAYCFDLAVDRFGHTLLAWLDGEDRNILARVFDLQGQPTSAETMVDEFGHNPGFPAVAFDLTGRALIAWRGYEELAWFQRYRLGCSRESTASR